MLTRTLLRTLATLLAASALPAVANAQILSVSFDFTNSSVHSINQSTGAGTLIGMAGFSRLNSLARDSAGNFWSAGGPADTDLIRINPSTGAGTAVATLTIPNMRGLAYSPLDVLYGVQHGIQSTDPCNLVTINRNTGLVTVIGNTGVSAIQDIAFSPSGTLYGWEVGNGVGCASISPSACKRC